MSEQTTVTEKEVTLNGAPYKEVTTTTATAPDPASAEAAAQAPAPVETPAQESI